MFLRRNRRSHRGSTHEYWSLMRTVRAAKGPRHESWKWAGLRSVICVRRETMRQRHSAETPAVETRYYLSSLKGSDAGLGRLTRNHWSVEPECSGDRQPQAARRVSESKPVSSPAGCHLP